MVGPFPPPVGGAAKITQAVLEAVQHSGSRVTSLDTSGAHLSHTRSPTYHARRMLRTLAVLVSLITLSARKRVFYVVPDGGKGVWYTAAYVRVSSLRCRRIVLHHHSCRYIEQHDKAMQLITRWTQGLAEHVFLTPGMLEAYQRRYGRVNARVVGNAAFSSSRPLVQRSSLPMIRLGHLSNLCTDKGFFEVADTFERLSAAGLPVELHLAGPALDASVSTKLKELSDSHVGSVVYHGVVSGREKDAFYDQLDVFLFPTSFAQEAAPNVIYEAAAAGVPTLSIDRGCISEITEALAGATCSRTDDFGNFVEQWLGARTRDELAGVQKEVNWRFTLLKLRSSRDLDELISSMQQG